MNNKLTCKKEKEKHQQNCKVDTPKIDGYKQIRAY